MTRNSSTASLGGPNRPRPRRKSSRGALSRSAAVPRHCLTYSEHTTGPVGPPRSPGEKGGRAKREKKTGCRCVLRFRQRRQRNDKRFAPCLTTFRFSFHGLYTSRGPRETEPAHRLSRAAVTNSLHLPSRPVVHGGIRATLFSQLAAFSLSFGVETPVKNLPSPPAPPPPPPLAPPVPPFFF